jgi:molybdopterin synthase catalytic subunit/molybdopterin converting factor small subunit
MIQVLYFAIVRERLGRSEEAFAWKVGMTVQGLSDEILEANPQLTPYLPYVRFALNETFVNDLSTDLLDGDVLALIPPVSGGNQLPLLTEAPIETQPLIDSVYGEDCGAIVTFEGRVRNHTGKHQVLHLDYEAYGSMAEKTLRELLIEVEAAFPSVRIRVQHRLGHLTLGDTAVAIVSAAPHRDVAFASCQRLIDRLKEDVPIFKKEARGNGSIWIGLGP